jgi:hypothetical protein
MDVAIMVFPAGFLAKYFHGMPCQYNSRFPEPVPNGPGMDIPRRNSDNRRT